MNTKSNKPLSQNIRNFIYANNMSRADFANELNDRMHTCYNATKIYTSNDIWTYGWRGSQPKDGKALTAIAEIIGQPLELLLTITFEMNELRREMTTVTVNTTTPQPATDQTTLNTWNINRLNELTEHEKDFVFNLVFSGVYDEHELWHSIFDVGMRYNQGKTVDATLFYGEDDIDNEDKQKLTWSWLDYGENMQTFDDEAALLEIKLESDIVDKLYSIGLIKDFYCETCGFEELFADGHYCDIHQYFIVTVFFAIDRDEIIKIMKKGLERSKLKLEQLRNELNLLEVNKSKN